MTTLTLHIEDAQTEAAIRQYLAQHHPEVMMDTPPAEHWEDLHPELRARIEASRRDIQQGRLQPIEPLFERWQKMREKG